MGNNNTEEFKELYTDSTVYRCLSIAAAATYIAINAFHNIDACIDAINILERNKKYVNDKCINIFNLEIKEIKKCLNEMSDKLKDFNDK